jgi:hypothetical protein
VGFEAQMLYRCFVKEETLRIRLLWQGAGGRRDFGLVSGWGMKKKLVTNFVSYHRRIRLPLADDGALSKKQNCGLGFCGKNPDSSLRRPGYLEDQLIVYAQLSKPTQMSKKNNCVPGFCSMRRMTACGQRSVRVASSIYREPQ